MNNKDIAVEQELLNKMANMLMDEIYLSAWRGPDYGKSLFEKNMQNQNHYWKVGDVFVDNSRNAYIIRYVHSQTYFDVLDLYSESDHGWVVEDDTHYVGNINPRAEEGGVVMTYRFGENEHYTQPKIIEENTIAQDLNKIK